MMVTCPGCYYVQPPTDRCTNPSCGVAMLRTIDRRTAVKMRKRKREREAPTAPPPPADEHDKLAAWFEKFHAKHPHVYRAFKEMALEIRAEGHARYGAKTIMERLRWESAVRYPGQSFKLDNRVKDRCTARYARLLIAEDPSFATFFELRAL